MVEIKSCGTCGYYETDVGVCCNPNSEYRADFVDEDSCCIDWEAGHFGNELNN